MSLYFFILPNGEGLCNGCGMAFADDAAALRFARSAAREAMSDAVRKGRLDLHHRIDVIDERGAAIFSLEFKDAIEIRDAEGAVSGGYSQT